MVTEKRAISARVYESDLDLGKVMAAIEGVQLQELIGKAIREYATRHKEEAREFIKRVDTAGLLSDLKLE